MSDINYKKQLVFAGILFTIHSFEKANGFKNFIYPTNFPLPIPPTSMILGIALITIIAWGFIVWTIIQLKEIIRRDLLLILISLFVLNAVFPPIAAIIIFQAYFPGIITAIILCLPYSFWLLPKLYRSYPSHNQFYWTISGGLIIASTLFIFLQFLIGIFLQFTVG